MATVAVLGGGVSGLSCAYYLSSLAKNKVKYVILLEKSSKFGGWIQTTKYDDGAICEHGPRTLRVPGQSGFNALSLAEELNLNSYIVPIRRDQPAPRRNLILVNNKLYQLPKQPRYLFRTLPPFSKPMWRFLLQDIREKSTADSDESIYDFGKRRFGEEVSKYVLDSLCRGIAAGDAKELSVRSLFPAFFEAERDHGSVIKGLLKKARSLPLLESSLAVQARQEFWTMWSLRGGLHQLIDTLACAVEDSGKTDMHVSANCMHIKFNDKAVLTVDGEEITVDHVFSSIPAKNLGELVPQYPVLRNHLLSINAVTVATVYLEYENRVIEDEAFGFLAPSCEDARVLGVIFDSCCFPAFNGKCQTRITCMMGGRWFNDVFGSPDSVSSDAILKVALEEVRKILGITALPVRHNVAVQKDCIPQYVVGHHGKVEAIDKEISEKKLCLSLLGASYKGAGVPDCIYNARAEVEKYLNIGTTA